MAHASNGGIRSSWRGILKARCLLTTLISYDKVTHLVEEGEALVIVCLAFYKAFDTAAHRARAVATGGLPHGFRKKAPHNSAFPSFSTVVLDFGGDILKFGGDAVLVLWRASEAQLPQTISLVLQCCQQIQKKHGSRDTHVGQKLHLKIGISAGQMTVLAAGDRYHQQYFICSQALEEVMNAQNLAVKSEVIVSLT
ncbi:adenylate cyclase type 10-like, partial [Aythya fuligula]|uniref:Adenylate cyclase type 10-like n=1 Tax=Aythya fuligula TaxID=219594 RepID=A0A6J3ELJ4_AYTFU